MQESVRSSSPVTEALPHIDLHAIPHPAKRVVRAAEAAAGRETFSQHTFYRLGGPLSGLGHRQ
jgi:hypothetical protein